MKFGVAGEFIGQKDKGWLSLPEIIDRAADLGFDGVEPAPLTHRKTIYRVLREDKGSLEKAVEKAKRRGIEIPSIHWAMSITPEIRSQISYDLEICSKDPAARSKAYHYMKKVIDYAHLLGAKKIIFGSPNQRNIPQGMDYSEGLGYLTEFFQQSCIYASSKGITICIEPLGRGETNIIRNRDEAIDLIKIVNRNNFGLILDGKAMEAEEPYGPATMIAGGMVQGDKGLIWQPGVSTDYLKHIHVNDRDKHIPRSAANGGHTKWTPIFEACKKIGYDDWAVMEPFVVRKGSDPLKDCRMGLRYMKQCYGNANRNPKA